MATAPNFVQAQPFKLAGSGSSIGDTTLTLQSMVGIDGNNLVTADISPIGYGTLEPGNGSQEEAIQFTGITQNANGTATLTGVSTLLFKQPYTATSGLTKIHAGASTFILSNDAAFYNNIIQYINGVAIAGAINATTGSAGIVQLASAAQINAGTATGSTGAHLVVTPDQLALSNYVPTLIPSGVISAYGGTSAPTGYLACDGSAVSRSTYASLFTAISTGWGAGDGSTTFNVPDLRSRSIVGSGTGTKLFTITANSGNTFTVTTPTGPTNSVNNEIQNGTAVVFNAGTAGNLVNVTTYYMVRVAYNQFKLATTLANAIGTGNGASGTSTVITLSGTEAGTFTYTLSARTVADTGGEENHNLVLGELPSHTHTVPGGSTTGGNLVTARAGSTDSTPSSSASGGSLGHNILSPFGVTLYIIKT